MRAAIQTLVALAAGLVGTFLLILVMAMFGGVGSVEILLAALVAFGLALLWLGSLRRRDRAPR